MNKLYTGYYIDEKGNIVSGRGPSNSYFRDNLIYLENGVQTSYSLGRGKIIYDDGDPTGYIVAGGGIFGPFKFLPWLR